MDLNDIQYMTRALSLARLGRGLVEPNPMVGAVIVSEGEIIGEGFHKKFSGPHAEIEAISAARKTGANVHGAAMYVTLEPCSHYGKTPPCAKALIDSGIARVIVAMQDPDEKVAGQGLEMLRHSGVVVDLGVCQNQARELLSPYIKLRTQGRPWVICKWAQTLDGAIALPPEKGRWISCKDSLTRVHELRSWCDGILVGVGTVLTDDPLLTNRSEGASRQCCRIVMDSHLRTPPTSQLVGTARENPVIIATTSEGLEASPARAEILRNANIEILELPSASGGVVDISALLEVLGKRQFTYLLVEGGAKILSGFIGTSQADELQVFISPQTAGQSELPRFDITEVLKGGEYSEISSEIIGVDTLRTFRLAAVHPG